MINEQENKKLKSGNSSKIYKSIIQFYRFIELFSKIRSLQFHLICVCRRKSQHIAPENLLLKVRLNIAKTISRYYFESKCFSFINVHV